MKHKNIILAIAIGTTSVLSFGVCAQDKNETSERKTERMDSVDIANQKALHVQEIKNENAIDDFRHDRQKTRANAKEAQRVEREANAAARESKWALRAEKRAQKSRKDANRQAEKAYTAREKSDKN